MSSPTRKCGLTSFAKKNLKLDYVDQSFGGSSYYYVRVTQFDQDEHEHGSLGCGCAALSSLRLDVTTPAPAASALLGCGAGPKGRTGRRSAA
jgi:hypothetical protein